MPATDIWQKLKNVVMIENHRRQHYCSLSFSLLLELLTFTLDKTY